MADVPSERVRAAVERAGLALYAGLLVALAAELAATLVTLSTLASGASPPWEFLPLPDVGVVGRAVWWTAVGVAGLELSERATNVDVARTRAGRRRTAWVLVGASGAGVVATMLAIGWLLGLVG